MAFPYKEQTDKALTYGKELFGQLGEFKSSGENKGTKTYTKDVTTTPMPITRGDITFPPEITVQAILDALRDLEFRKKWDPRFEDGKVIELFDDKTSGIVHSFQKGQMFVSGRDFAVAFHVYHEGDVAYYVQTSVEDSRIPVTSSRVRAELTVAIWILRPSASGSGTDVTYITHVNPNGTIPSTLLKLVASETPACAGGLLTCMKAQ